MAFRHERRSALITSPSTRIGAVPNFKPARDVHVPVVSAVACPSCGAAVGDKCLNLKTGAVMASGSSHPVRRRMAVRLFNAQRESTT